VSVSYCIRNNLLRPRPHPRRNFTSATSKTCLASDLNRGSAGAHPRKLAYPLEAPGSVVHQRWQLSARSCNLAGQVAVIASFHSAGQSKESSRPRLVAPRGLNGPCEGRPGLRGDGAAETTDRNCGFWSQHPAHQMRLPETRPSMELQLSQVEISCHDYRVRGGITFANSRARANSARSLRRPPPAGCRLKAFGAPH